MKRLVRILLAVSVALTVVSCNLAMDYAAEPTPSQEASTREALVAGSLADGAGGGYAGWAISGPGTTGVQKGDKGSRILSYYYAQDSYEPEQAWVMAKQSDEAGSLGIEWKIAGFHGWYEDWIELYAFADGPAGRAVQTLVATPHGEPAPGEIDGDFEFFGFVTLEVTAGYDFGFIVKGANYSALGWLTGDLTVKERD
jgi:hypothetical protein